MAGWKIYQPRDPQEEEREKNEQEKRAGEKSGKKEGRRRKPIQDGTFVATVNSTYLRVSNILPRETNQDYDNFIDKLSHILDNFEQNPHNVALFGDYNIDLLKIKERPKVNEFFELMMTNGFILKITLPTRFSRNNATLIDNVFCKISHNLSTTFSAISLSNISDHQPYIVPFDYLNMYKKPTKLVKIQSYKDTDILNFKADLQSYDLNELINQDPRMLILMIIIMH